MWMILALWLQSTGQPLISDQLGHELIQAGSTIVVLFVMALGLWVLIRPLVNGFVNRNRNIDATTQAFIDESRSARDDAKAAHEDNRRLIELMEKGREDDRKMTEAIQNLTGAVQQSTETTMKLINVAMGNIQQQQQETQKLPGILQKQHDHSVERVTDAMNQAFAEVIRQVGELRAMVEALGQKSTTDHNALVKDVRVILDRIDTIQQAADKLPDTGSLAGKVATGPDAVRRDSPAPTTPPDADTPKEK